jgi:uncharacterized protein YjhX (UPF0386 family)
VPLKMMMNVLKKMGKIKKEKVTVREGDVEIDFLGTTFRKLKEHAKVKEIQGNGPISRYL